MSQPLYELYPLSDNKGSVSLIDKMGSDLTVVNAARVSFHKEHAVFEESDKKLLDFLARNGHWTPFAHVMFQFRIKMPIFLARQWWRHSVGFARNEVSRRYVTDDPEVYTPLIWRMQATDRKQGSSEEINSDSGMWSAEAIHLAREASRTYRMMIKDGVAAEQARMILPQSMYTEWIETASLYAYARLCKERLQPDAQAEIREYATAVGAAAVYATPESWHALMSRA